LAKFFGGSIESCFVSPGYGYPRTCGNEQSRGSQAYAGIATRNQGSLTFKFHVWCNDRVSGFVLSDFASQSRISSTSF
jgi:hypothetical protein